MTISGKLFFLVSLGTLVVLLVPAIKFGDQTHRIGMLIFPAVVGALVGWIITGLVSVFRYRPFGAVDAVRSSAWMLIGWSEGMREFVSSYYGAFWPQYAGLA